MTSKTRAPRSRRRRLLFAIILLSIGYVVIEGISYVVYRQAFGESHSFSTVHEMQAARISGQLAEEKVVVDALVTPHPYLGYVYSPSWIAVQSRQFERDPAQEHGFYDTAGPLRRRRPGRKIVALVGGSVAAQVSVDGTEAMAAALRRHDAFRDQEIEFVRLALAGYKQPQQLLLVSYLLTLGAEFDVIIALDGFNEIAIAWTEQIPQGVYPFYPQNWRSLARAPGRAESIAIAGIVQTEQSRRDTASFFSSRPLRYSITCGALWRAYDQRLETSIAEQRVALAQMGDTDDPFYVTGPKLDTSDVDATYDSLVASWKQGTWQLDRLCAANGIDFFEFLQPNQYVEGSKKLTAEERSVAYDETSGYRDAVLKGWSKLRDGGIELRTAGVRYHDASSVFVDVAETLYYDSCCHFNARGCAIVGKAIGEIVGETLSKDGFLSDRVHVTRPTEFDISQLLGAKLVIESSAEPLDRPLAAQKLSVAAHFEDGRRRPLHPGYIEFLSQDEAVAGVSPQGRITARRPGRTTVRARVGKLEASYDVEVAFPEIASFGTGVSRRGPIPRLSAVIEKNGDVTLRVDRALGGTSGSLLVAFEVADVPWCGGKMNVLNKGAIALPLSTSGNLDAEGVGTAELVIPAKTLAGRGTVYLQAFIDEYHGHDPCRAATNAIALSLR